MDAEALGLRQERPGGLAVDLVSVAQARFERARVRRVEPLQEVRAAEALGALRDEDYVAAFRAGVSSHLQRLVRLNQVDVVGRAAGGGDDERALLRDLYRVRVGVLGTGAAVGRAPVAGVEAHDAPALVRHRVDEERGRALGGDALALLVHGVAVESSGADARAPPAPLEVERLEVRRLDGARGGQSGADALAPAREACEVVEADGAGEDDVRVVEEGAVELDRRAALGLAERDVARRG